MRMTGSWSGSNDPTYKSVARRCAPMASSPWDPQPTDRYRPDAEAMQKSPCRRSSSLRELIVDDGTKNGLPAPSKELVTTKNNYLRGKAPHLNLARETYQPGRRDCPSDPSRCGAPPALLFCNESTGRTRLSSRQTHRAPERSNRTTYDPNVAIS
jgi:hypothetical protein